MATLMIYLKMPFKAAVITEKEMKKNRILPTKENF